MKTQSRRVTREQLTDQEWEAFDRLMRLVKELVRRIDERRGFVR